MKLSVHFNWFNKLFAGDSRAKKLELIREQRQILSRGLEASAEVIDADLQNDFAGNMVLVKLLLKLKKTDGSFLYANTATLVTLRHMPGKGQFLHIKYIPGRMSSVVIL